MPTVTPRVAIKKKMKTTKKMRGRTSQEKNTNRIKITKQKISSSSADRERGGEGQEQNGRQERLYEDSIDNNNDNNDCISRAPFHVKHAHLRFTSANTKIKSTCILTDYRTRRGENGDNMNGSHQNSANAILTRK